ncbi:hypothetical protein GGS20DRAFT_526685 [Poronia punctata]|nr:hypothetical protein GGS20DRAFT_526685 [Poronia punctata]
MESKYTSCISVVFLPLCVPRFLFLCGAHLVYFSALSRPIVTLNVVPLESHLPCPQTHTNIIFSLLLVYKFLPFSPPFIFFLSHFSLIHIFLSTLPHLSLSLITEGRSSPFSSSLSPSHRG